MRLPKTMAFLKGLLHISDSLIPEFTMQNLMLKRHHTVCLPTPTALQIDHEWRASVLRGNRSFLESTLIGCSYIHFSGTSETEVPGIRFCASIGDTNSSRDLGFLNGGGDSVAWCDVVWDAPGLSVD